MVVLHINWVCSLDLMKLVHAARIKRCVESNESFGEKRTCPAFPTLSLSFYFLISPQTMKLRICTPDLFTGSTSVRAFHAYNSTSLYTARQYWALLVHALCRVACFKVAWTVLQWIFMEFWGAAGSLLHTLVWKETEFLCFPYLIPIALPCHYVWAYILRGCDVLCRQSCAAADSRCPVRRKCLAKQTARYRSTIGRTVA